MGNETGIQHINDKTMLIQHVSNKSRYVSAWLYANPADQMNKLNNMNFNICVKSRLLLPQTYDPRTRTTKKYCKCGDQLDDLLVHSYSCCKNGRQIINSIRNPMHEQVKKLIIQLINEYGKDGKNNLKVINGEPILSQYFPSTSNSSDNFIDNNDNTRDEEDFSNNHNTDVNNSIIYRGDICMKNINTGFITIIDTKTTEPNSLFQQPHAYAEQCANKGQSVKEKDYQRRKIDIRPNDQREMNFCTFTTYGAPSKDAKKLINKLAEHDSYLIQQMRKQQIYQKIACTFQTIRSDNIDKIRSKEYYSLIDRPIPHPSNNPININRNYTNTSQLQRSSENIGNMRNINNSNISQSQRSSSGNHNSISTSRNNNDDTNTSQTLRSSIISSENNNSNAISRNTNTNTSQSLSLSRKSNSSHTNTSQNYRHTSRSSTSSTVFGYNNNSNSPSRLIGNSRPSRISRQSGLARQAGNRNRGS